MHICLVYRRENRTTPTGSTFTFLSPCHMFTGSQFRCFRKKAEVRGGQSRSEIDELRKSYPKQNKVGYYRLGGGILASFQILLHAQLQQIPVTDHDGCRCAEIISCPHMYTETHFAGAQWVRCWATTETMPKSPNLPQDVPVNRRLPSQHFTGSGPNTAACHLSNLIEVQDGIFLPHQLSICSVLFSENIFFSAFIYLSFKILIMSSASCSPSGSSLKGTLIKISFLWGRWHKKLLMS